MNTDVCESDRPPIQNNTLTWCVPPNHALANKRDDICLCLASDMPEPKTVFYEAVMEEKGKESFSIGVAEKLGCYVYRLIDPRDGQTFYIGRGQGNRIFDHVNEQEKLELNDHKTVKLETIREIRRAGLRPIHIIHRHQLTEDVAKEVEAALIDATPGLKNLLKGKGPDRGPANTEQLDRRYSKEVIDPKNHKLLYIKINEGTLRERGSLYEAVRRDWSVNPERAERADYVLAVINKIVRGVFTDCKWRRLRNKPKKSEFIGREEKGDIADEYVGKLIPPKYSKQGMASPVLFGWNDANDDL